MVGSLFQKIHLDLKLTEVYNTPVNKLLNENILSVLDIIEDNIHNATKNQHIMYPGTIAEILAALRCYKHVYGSDDANTLGVTSLISNKVPNKESVETLKKFMLKCWPQYQTEVRFLTNMIQDAEHDGDYSDILHIITVMKEWLATQQHLHFNYNKTNQP